MEPFDCPAAARLVFGDLPFATGATVNPTVGLRAPEGGPEAQGSPGRGPGSLASWRQGV